MAHLTLLERAKAHLASARFLQESGPDDIAGIAGLAFQAVDLAGKVLTAEIDGEDAGSHRARMIRTQEIVRTQQGKLDFLWNIRQRDFYGDDYAGGPASTPTTAQVKRALNIASEIIERIDRELHPIKDARKNV
jgi:HEPN domain-containing protein